MTILQQAWNWKCIKYLQEAFKASESIFTGTRAGVCIAQGGLCVPKAKNSPWETFPLPKVILAGKPFTPPCPPKKGGSQGWTCHISEMRYLCEIQDQDLDRLESNL